MEEKRGNRRGSQTDTRMDKHGRASRARPGLFELEPRLGPGSSWDFQHPCSLPRFENDVPGFTSSHHVLTVVDIQPQSDELDVVPWTRARDRR